MKPAPIRIFVGLLICLFVFDPFTALRHGSAAEKGQTAANHDAK